MKPTLQGLLSQLHVLMVDHGLGREPYMQRFVTSHDGFGHSEGAGTAVTASPAFPAETRARLTPALTQGMFLVLDADSLILLGRDPSLIKGYRRAILTLEFEWLSEQVVSTTRRAPSTVVLRRQSGSVVSKHAAD